MRKLAIILACMMVWSWAGTLALNIPHFSGYWSYSMCAVLMLIPIGLFIAAVRGFRSWHKPFHRRMIREGLIMRRSDGPGIRVPRS